MESSDFTPYVCEQLGWYVYALKDPRSNKIFYIGKGKDNRVFEHARDAKALEEDDSSAKIALIKEILKSGKDVQQIIIRHGLKDSRTAYEVEAALIDLLHVMDPKTNNKYYELTNLVKGHHHESLGAMNVSDAIALYSAEKCPKITEKVILFKIQRRWTPSMSEAAIFESTHGWWVLGADREKAKFGFCVSNGVIRRIYRIKSWRRTHEGDRDWNPSRSNRWGFDGEIAPEMSLYLNKDVRHLYKKGEASPTKYLNIK